MPTNKIHCVLEDPSDQTLVCRTGEYDATLPFDEAAVKSGWPVVAVFTERHPIGAPTEGLWQEFSGHEILSVEQTFNGACVLEHIGSGPDKATKCTDLFSDGSQNAKRALPTDAALTGKGSQYNVLDEGGGSHYTSQLAAARTLVGIP